MRALILGGTFNPVHVGHVRLAIEAAEGLGSRQVIWLPSYSPHYRCSTHLLPFGLRLKLLVAALPAFGKISDIERRHEGTAYSADVVPELCREERVTDPYFVLGLENFRHLHLWRRATDLSQFTSFAVTARDEADLKVFHRLMRVHWPDCRALEAVAGTHAVYEGLAGRRIVLLEMPRLDISASLIRQRWREGRDISLLVPDAVRDVLENHRDAVDAAWLQETPRGEDRRPFPH